MRGLSGVRAQAVGGLEEAFVALTRGKPELFNSDQGFSWTSLDVTIRLRETGVRIHVIFY